MLCGGCSECMSKVESFVPAVWEAAPCFRLSHVHAHAYTCTSCMCRDAFLHMYIRTCMCRDPCLHMYIRTCMCRDACLHMYIRTCMCRDTYMHVQGLPAHVHTYMHACLHMYIRTCMCRDPCLHMYIRTCMCREACLAHVHTYMHVQGSLPCTCTYVHACAGMPAYFSVSCRRALVLVPVCNAMWCALSRHQLTSLNGDFCFSASVWVVDVSMETSCRLTSVMLGGSHDKAVLSIP